MAEVTIIEGDLLDQDVEVLVNAWNRNLFPWWLLIPQGVSAAIRRRAGRAPFRELRGAGLLELGEAVQTGAGELAQRAIIHVAGIGLTWRSSERSVRASVRNAMALVQEGGFVSVAFPLIGAGTGGGSPEQIEAMIREELESIDYDGRVVIVRYRPP